ncbi:MAG: M6 family metalloprotease domain-containing protein [bacterium]
MKSFKLWILVVIICMNLCGINIEISGGEVFLCPPHPDLLEKLKKEGRLEEISRLLVKKPQYIDRPLPITTAVIGTKSAVVLLIQFPDKAATTSSSHFSDLLLSKGSYSTGSMRDYYCESSYGKLDIEGGISNWYTANNNYNNYIPEGKWAELIKETIEKANPDVNFAQYDKNNDGIVDILIVVHAGSGGEEGGNDIWSHMSKLVPPVVVDNKYITAYAMCPENGKIGVFSHEVGHLLGLPDLYDTDKNSEGIGKWSLMSSGNWLGSPYGVSPAHPDAWCKIQLGWVTPTTVTTNMDNVQIPQIETNPTIYKLWKSGQPGKEYFLVENRQKVGFDSYLPGSGLLIYHVDEKIKDYYLDSNEWNKHQWYPGLNPLPYNHYLVAVEQADGKWDLEKNINRGDSGDIYYSNRLFYNYSTPNSKDYYDNLTYVAVTNISNSQSTMIADLWINATFTPTTRRIIVYPNPFYSKDKQITFAHLPDNSIIKIFTIAGELITTIRGDNVGEAKWQPVDIASGIYLYLIESEGKVIEKGKVGVLR